MGLVTQTASGSLVPTTRASRVFGSRVKAVHVVTQPLYAPRACEGSPLQEH